MLFIKRSLTTFLHEVRGRRIIIIFFYRGYDSFRCSSGGDILRIMFWSSVRLRGTSVELCPANEPQHCGVMSKFGLIMKMHQRWWCLATELNTQEKKTFTLISFVINSRCVVQTFCCLSAPKHRNAAGLRLLHLQFAQQKCIYMYMEEMYFCNTFLQVHIPFYSIPVLESAPTSCLTVCLNWVRS